MLLRSSPTPTPTHTFVSGKGSALTHTGDVVDGVAVGRLDMVYSHLVGFDIVHISVLFLGYPCAGLSSNPSSFEDLFTKQPPPPGACRHFLVLRQELGRSSTHVLRYLTPKKLTPMLKVSSFF